MMKYLVVMPAAILCGVVILWLLYSSLNKSEETRGNAFNTEIPAGESDGIKSKAEEYEAAEVAREHESRQVEIATLDTLSNATDTVTRQTAVETSAQAYQEVQASLNDFYIPENTQAQEVAELQARIDELEAQNALAQQQAAQPDEMELMERSYQLAAQYMGNGGNYSPPQPAEEKVKRDVMTGGAGKQECGILAWSDFNRQRFQHLGGYNEGGSQEYHRRSGRRESERC